MPHESKVVTDMGAHEPLTREEVASVIDGWSIASRAPVFIPEDSRKKWKPIMKKWKPIIWFLTMLIFLSMNV